MRARGLTAWAGRTTTENWKPGVLALTGNTGVKTSGVAGTQERQTNVKVGRRVSDTACLSNIALCGGKQLVWCVCVVCHSTTWQSDACGVRTHALSERRLEPPP